MPLERRINTPKGALSQQVPVEDRLILSYKADQDFLATAALLDATQAGVHRDIATLKVSKELTRTGRQPLFSPDHFFNVANQLESWNRSDIYEEVSLLQAEMGDVSSALSTAERTYGFSWFYNDLARVLARKGSNPQPVFDRIHNKLRIDAGSTNDVREAGQTLEVQRDLGLAAPKHLIDRFRVMDRKRDAYSNSYNLELAESYAKAGFPDDALDIWRLARDTGYHYTHKASVLPYIALAQARNEVNPSETVATAIEYADRLKTKVDKKQIPSFLEAEIYSNLSRVYTAYGLDPRPLISTALQRALEISDFDQVVLDNIRADAYTQIARAQIESGIDARPTLVLALQWADQNVKPGENCNSGYCGSIQLLNWENIYRAQLVGEYFDDARKTLDRMDRYPDQDIKSMKAELLAELAREQGKKGLSSEEIIALTLIDIRAILIGKNEVAKQAALHFGLDKRLSPFSSSL